jgi:hypothetical protein
MDHAREERVKNGNFHSRRHPTRTM